MYKIVEDQTIVWSENTNEYLVLENTTADILKKLSTGITVKEIATNLSKKIAVPFDKTIDFVLNLEKKICSTKPKEKATTDNNYSEVRRPKQFEFTKYYKINNLVFKIEFSSEYECYLIHPKFAHLEVRNNNESAFTFTVFLNKNAVFLYVDKALIGAWDQ